MTSLHQKFDKWLFHSFPLSNEQLGLYRIGYCILVIFILGVPNFTWLGKNPDFIYNPPLISVVSFVFHRFPDPIFLQILSTGMYVLFGMLLFGFYTRTVSVLLTLFMILGYNLIYSLGKTDHNSVFVFLPLIMAFSGWGNAFSIDAQRAKKPLPPPQTWLVTLAAVFIAFTMFTAGLPKLLSGWLDPATQVVKLKLAFTFADYFTYPMLMGYFARVESFLFWEFIDYGAIIFELGIVVALLRPNAFRFFVILALVFHLLNAVMLCLSFYFNFGLYLLFMNWGIFSDRLASSSFHEKMNRFFTLRNLLIFVAIHLSCLYLIQWWGKMPLMASPSLVKFILFNIGIHGQLDLFTSLTTVTIGFMIAAMSLYAYFQVKKEVPSKTLA